MRVQHTGASRAAVLAAVALGLVQLGWAARAVTRPLAGAAVVLAVATLLAGAKLARDNCFDSRLALVVLASLQLGVGLLAVTVGLPGRSPQHGDPVALATLGVAAAATALVGVDRRARRTRAAVGPNPPHYAR